MLISESPRQTGKKYPSTPFAAVADKRWADRPTGSAGEPEHPLAAGQTFAAGSERWVTVEEAHTTPATCGPRRTALSVLFICATVGYERYPLPKEAMWLCHLVKPGAVVNTQRNPRSTKKGADVILFVPGLASEVGGIPGGYSHTRILNAII
jgi:hypothetical protein